MNEQNKKVDKFLDNTLPIVVLVLCVVVIPLVMLFWK